MKIYLIPTPLAEDTNDALPPATVSIAQKLDVFIVERAKTARHFLKSISIETPLSNLTIFEMNEAGEGIDFQAIKQILDTGKSIGVLSEAGCPGVADPGAKVVAWAHRNSIEVVPLVGPSSILLAVMASGMNGQSFAFNGYASAKRDTLIQDLRRYEANARRLSQTQVFIETPYRNRQLIETALSCLAPDTLFGIAADLTAPPQYIAVKTVAEWRKTQIPDLHKRTAIFMIGIK